MFVEFKSNFVEEMSTETQAEGNTHLPYTVRTNDTFRVYFAATALARTEALQAEAADPDACAWVSANAGTGKTHVLSRRVLRLLLAGTAPERILCLTYTKAAAAEMANRVFDELARWVTLADEALATSLEKLVGRDPTPADRERARTLFACAIEAPGGLKVQTIHAFC